MLKKMKLSTPVLLAALSVVAGLLLLVFVGCSAQTPTPETPETEEGGGRAAGTISATGEVVPAQKATLSFTTSGTLVTLNVDVGDRVQRGDVIGELDTAVIDAEIARAEATVRVAEANLAQIKADPRTPSIEQLKSNMAAASASLAEAVANRDKVRAGASDYEIARAKADTQAAFIHAMDERFLRDYLLDLLDEPEDWDECDPTPKKPCPPADNSAEWMDEKFVNAQEKYEIAYDNLIAAEAYLDDLLDGPNPDQLRVAEAEVWASSAEYLMQKARLDLLLAGAQIEDVDIAEIAVDQARAALETARVSREKAVLLAPFDGVIAEVYIREKQYASTGLPIVLLADLDNLRVETTDLNEIDVATIQVGDVVTVNFDALPDQPVTGQVIRISPRAEEGAGVNFTIVISLDSVPTEIRWGMTAFVDIVK